LPKRKIKIIDKILILWYSIFSTNPNNSARGAEGKELNMTILQKQKDRKFTILNFSDPQLSNAEWGEGHPNGILLRETITAMIDEVKPDLITVSGDLAWASEFVAYDMLAKFLDSFGIPWAPVFGNHDNQHGPEAVCKAAEIMKAQKTCLLEQGDPAMGYGNYVIGIEEEGRLIHGLILMDSHDRKAWVDEQGNHRYDWADIEPNQFPWYREQVEMLKAKGAKESSLLMHIPLYTYRTAVEAALRSDIDRSAVSPFNGEQGDCWNPGFENSFGVLYEGISSFERENGFFDEILAADHTKTVLCGHDHVNTIGVYWHGVLLAFTLKTGCGCYWNPKITGGTVMTVDSDGKMEIEHRFYRPANA
jgi:hypothetical protein